MSIMDPEQPQSNHFTMSQDGGIVYHHPLSVTDPALAEQLDRIEAKLEEIQRDMMADPIKRAARLGTGPL